jgi:hypothetical protein
MDPKDRVPGLIMAHRDRQKRYHFRRFCGLGMALRDRGQADEFGRQF